MEYDSNKSNAFSRALEREEEDSEGSQSGGTGGQTGRIGYDWDPLAQRELVVESLDRIQRGKRKKDQSNDRREHPNKRRRVETGRNFIAGSFEKNPALVKLDGCDPDVNPSVAVAEEAELSGEVESNNNEYRHELQNRPVPGARLQQALRYGYEKKFNPRPTPFG